MMFGYVLAALMLIVLYSMLKAIGVFFGGLYQRIKEDNEYEEEWDQDHGT